MAGRGGRESPAKRRARAGGNTYSLSDTTTTCSVEVTPPGLYHWGLRRRHVWALCASPDLEWRDPRPVKGFPCARDPSLPRPCRDRRKSSLCGYHPLLLTCTLCTYKYSRISLNINTLGNYPFLPVLRAGMQYMPRIQDAQKSSLPVISAQTAYLKIISAEKEKKLITSLRGIRRGVQSAYLYVRFKLCILCCILAVLRMQYASCLRCLCTSGI